MASIKVKEKTTGIDYMGIRITKQSTTSTATFFVVMMTVLVVFSSCTVRKTVQTFLDIPVAKPLNVNKATISNGNTCELTSFESITARSLKHLSIDAAIFTHDDLSLQLQSFPGNSVRTPENSNVTQQLPYYILYKQMKVFS